mmetsp:Transcript_110239/g.219020  ORF Transcript_110239/g.219020 Transcript_110239/m.219020 type:complete len:219 (-) Transcript_110239:76-732(-)
MNCEKHQKVSASASNTFPQPPVEMAKSSTVASSQEPGMYCEFCQACVRTMLMMASTTSVRDTKASPLHADFASPSTCARSVAPLSSMPVSPPGSSPATGAPVAACVGSGGTAVTILVRSSAYSLLRRRTCSSSSLQSINGLSSSPSCRAEGIQLSMVRQSRGRNAGSVQPALKANALTTSVSPESKAALSSASRAAALAAPSCFGSDAAFAISSSSFF